MVKCRAQHPCLHLLHLTIQLYPVPSACHPHRRYELMPHNRNDVWKNWICFEVVTFEGIVTTKGLHCPTRAKESGRQTPVPRVVVRQVVGAGSRYEHATSDFQQLD
ncbi:hypothetical protein C8J56DRAFT_980487, partial [Mycena floridula]